MAHSSRFSARVRRASILFTGGALLFAAGACETLVGIKDTTVADDASAGTSTNAGAPSAGAAHAGGPTVSNAGSVGSAADGGDDETAGSASAGKSAGKGGSANGGSAGKGNSGGSAGKDNTTSGGSASAGTAGSATQCDCTPPTPVCQSGQCVALGPTEAPAGSVAGNTTFYIDSTEVTNAQYAVFLGAKGGDMSGQRTECTWNDSYQPSMPIGDDKRPAVNVDFCDAAAYCDWAGERLCGDLSGGSVAITDLEDASKSQWYLACGGPDADRYPYGGFDFKADYCNVYNSGTMADAGQFSMCEGHYAGVFDMIGNAAEWVDACDNAGGSDHSQDNCWLMGGSYLRDDYNCQTHYDSLRSDTAAVFGFRCCSK